MDGQSQSIPPKVFISYSHDSRAHAQRVLDLSNRLRADGIDCHIDQYEVAPAEGWPMWMDRQIDEADLVLMILTETYLRRFKAREEPGKGLGVRWESMLVVQDIYDGGSWNEKYVPVTFGGVDVEHIPRPLRGVARFTLEHEDGYEQLFRRLLNIPGAKKPPLGRLRPVVPLEAKPEFFAQPSRLYTVPLPDRNFVGRECEIARLREALFCNRAVSVAGLAGVGKTELVIQTLHQLAAAGTFRGGIFWLNAEGGDLTAEWGDVIASELGVGEKRSSDERCKEVIRKLSDETGERVLVVLDNVLSWKPEPPKPIPEGTHVVLLATTQVRELSYRDFESQEIKVFTRDLAIEFLRKTAGRSLEKAPGFDDLLERVDGHARELSNASAWLRGDPSATPKDYLAALEQHPPQHATFAALWAKLEKPVRSAWQTAAWCAPAPVTPTFSGAIGVDADARQALRKYYLIDDAGGDGSWRMHRLTSRYGRKHAGEAKSREDSCEAFVVGAIEGWPKETDGWARKSYLPDRMHFESAMAHAGEGYRAKLSALIDKAHRSLGEEAASGWREGRPDILEQLKELTHKSGDFLSDIVIANISYLSGQLLKGQELAEVNHNKAGNRVRKWLASYAYHNTRIFLGDFADAARDLAQFWRENYQELSVAERAKLFEDNSFRGSTLHPIVSVPRHILLASALAGRSLRAECPVSADDDFDEQGWATGWYQQADELGRSQTEHDLGISRSFAYAYMALYYILVEQSDSDARRELSKVWDSPPVSEYVKYGVKGLLALRDGKWGLAIEHLERSRSQSGSYGFINPILLPAEATAKVMNSTRGSMDSEISSLEESVVLPVRLQGALHQSLNSAAHAVISARQGNLDDARGHKRNAAQHRNGVLRIFDRAFDECGIEAE